MIFFLMVLLFAADTPILAPIPVTLSRSFEFRYFTDDPNANGETDFRGETEVFDTDQRVQFLHNYAEYAKPFFRDHQLDHKIVPQAEVAQVLKNLKPQPLPKIRNKIIPVNFKWLGYKKGQREKQIEALSSWHKIKGAKVKDDSLFFTGSFLNDTVKFKRFFSPQTWRFFIQFKAKVHTAMTNQFVYLANSNKVTNAQSVAATVGFAQNGRMFYTSEGKEVALDSYDTDRWYNFKMEVDLANGRYNLYVDDQLKADFVKLETKDVNQINAFGVQGKKGTALDDIWGFGSVLVEEKTKPILRTTFIDQHFDIKPSPSRWQMIDYNDNKWAVADLPIAHGSERYAGEDLYLRKIVDIGDFEKAILKIETLDPGGEIWINGTAASVITNRHPVELDITKYLRTNDKNLIAIKVNHFYAAEGGIGHAGTDLNFGWFAGRASLELTSKTSITDVFVHSKDVADPASVQVDVPIDNKSGKHFKGSMVINCYPWFPEESTEPVATAKAKIHIGPWQSETIEKLVAVPNPKLWTFAQPHLYKIEVVLEDNSGKAVDDYVVTSGIRTVSQDGGIFRINGLPEMLNGAQTMGPRPPVDKQAIYTRCPPMEINIEEVLMIKKMNGNFLRIHVHSWHSEDMPSRSVNDPRLAEIGDQLGIMFTWPTTAWIRTGEPFAVDWHGYPKYMKQVYNHPSIVMWEVSNHPNKFKEQDISQSNLFYEKVWDTIYPLDQSRLISATSHLWHTHFGNDAGTIDYKGKPIQATPAYTAHMITRGNQDSITGYGAKWTALRRWPNKATRTLIESNDRAYFNFEHEESIAQPNWDLVKGKSWYQVQSYEWDYDIGSIGRRLGPHEWQESQAWQAFSAYESMKKQRILDYDGFSWCCLHGGANCVTYKKPLIDFLGHAKLAWHTNKMAFQRILAGSNDVDVVYGPNDMISPVIMNLGPARTVDLKIVIRDTEHRMADAKAYHDIRLPAGRTLTALPDYKPKSLPKGYYAVEYHVIKRQGI